jgi:hypothetical protein
MRRFLGAVTIGLVFAALAATRATSAGVGELGRFLGTWQSPGTFVDTPYSKASTVTATTTCAWSNDRVFMICQQSSVMNGKADHAVAVYTYDAAKDQYRFYNVGAKGGNGSVIAVQGNTITYTDSFTDNGKPVTIRTLNIWESASLYRWRTEYTSDAGATWTLMGSGTAALAGSPSH